MNVTEIRRAEPSRPRRCMAGTPGGDSLFIVFMVVLARTRFGRSVYMVGGNPTASRLTGINSQRVLVGLYMLTAAFSALGGCIMTARMSSGQPMSCEGLEFDAVTAASYVPVVVLGGAKRGNEAAMLADIAAAIAAGGAGVAIGRNIFQADDPAAMTADVAAIVHQTVAVLD